MRSDVGTKGSARDRGRIPFARFLDSFAVVQGPHDPTRPSAEPARPERFTRPDHERSPFFSRRRFLRGSGLALAGATMYACTGGGRKDPIVTPTTSASVVAQETRWPIKRVVYLMMENRSFDNLFGRFPGANGTTVGLKLGQEVPLTDCPHWLPGDIPHDRAAHLNDVNGGAYDGFANGKYGDPWAYTQFDGHDVPNYWQMAKDYVLCDNFFASVGGPSYPNHFFFVAGSSGGTLDNPENILTRDDGNGKRFKSWGCDAVGDDVFVLVKDEKGNLTKHDSCFDFPTVPEQLESAGVSWSYYSASPHQSGYFWNALNGVAGVYHTDLWREETIRPVDRLVRDIKADALPSVSWVTPRFELSDHPPESTCFTHNWITDVVNALIGATAGSTPRCSSPGTSGAACTTRSCRRRWTTSDSASASRCSSSAPTRRRATSTTPRASSRRRSSSSRTTGGSTTSPRGSRTPTTSSTSSILEAPANGPSDAEARLLLRRPVQVAGRHLSRLAGTMPMPPKRRRSPRAGTRPTRTPTPASSDDPRRRVGQTGRRRPRQDYPRLRERRVRLPPHPGIRITRLCRYVTKTTADVRAGVVGIRPRGAPHLDPLAARVEDRPHPRLAHPVVDPAELGARHASRRVGLRGAPSGGPTAPTRQETQHPPHRPLLFRRT